MVIETESLFQWLVAAVGGIISVLAGMAIYNNRTRYRELEDRLSKVEDRMNTTIPKTIQELHTKITEIEGSLREINTKVNLISDSVIQRMNKLENDLPGIVEAAMYRTLAVRNHVNQDDHN